MPLKTDDKSSAAILTELKALNMDSDDFGSNLGSVLQSQQHYKVFASGLRGEGRKSLIEFLDKVSF
jgi:hypothetical protein